MTTEAARDEHDDRQSVERRRDDGAVDRLVREEPLLIRVHGSDLLTMRTPGRDEDLAVGFLLGEGVIAAADAVDSVVATAGAVATLTPDSVVVALRDPSAARATGRLSRTHEIRPSCGVCGSVDAEAVLEEVPPLLPGLPRLRSSAIDALRRRFETMQPLFRATGASHAAALFGVDGELWGHGEDVGRHNALDKAIGAAARAGRPLDRAVAMLSGRAGADLVLKCLRVRIAIVLSVSAPSAFAFDLCRTAGATLVGFVRAGRAQVYCDAARLIGEGTP